MRPTQMWRHVNQALIWEKISNKELFKKRTCVPGVVQLFSTIFKTKAYSSGWLLSLDNDNTLHDMIRKNVQKIKHSSQYWNISWISIFWHNLNLFHYRLSGRRGSWQRTSELVSRIRHFLCCENIYQNTDVWVSQVLTAGNNFGWRSLLIFQRPGFHKEH